MHTYKHYEEGFLASTLQITVPLTPAGIAEARADVDRAAELLRQSGKVVAFAKHPARRIFRRAAGRRSREILDLLPVGKEAAMTPQELARKMSPDARGNRLSKASARAAIRNIQRCETHLLAEGLSDRRVVQIDWSRYEQEGAARYFVSAEDKRVINKSIDKEGAG
jgi:hypothetical protein